MVSINSEHFEVTAIFQAEDIVKEFPDVFDGNLGTLPSSQSFTLKPNLK